jgi:NADH:ubiquinone oxidoreductase subunit 3 (subunit A)
MSSSLLVVVAIVVVLVLLIVLGVVIALVVRRNRHPEVEHRPLDPSVIQCFPPGHPREGQPIPPGERDDQRH